MGCGATRILITAGHAVNARCPKEIYAKGLWATTNLKSLGFVVADLAAVS